MTAPVSGPDTTLTEILVNLGIDSEAIVPDASLTKDLKLDSTEMVDVSLELRRRFGVDVKLESKKELRVADVLRLLNEALVAAASPQAGLSSNGK